MRQTLAVASAVALVVAACSSTSENSDDRSPPQLLQGSSAPTAPRVPAALAGFEVIGITVDGTPLTVALASTPAERSQGLMGVRDLEGIDGMLFEFGDDTTGGFWMKDTLIPLDIYFFDASGDQVDDLAMEPCATDPCPVYQPKEAYRLALEVPSGSLSVGPAARLERST